jgi:uncharacterized Fe-S cluster protein YjdI
MTGALRSFLVDVDGPWIHPDATDVSQLVEVARCPSCAITYARNGGWAEEWMSLAQVRLRR